LRGNIAVQIENTISRFASMLRAKTHRTLRGSQSMRSTAQIIFVMLGVALPQSLTLAQDYLNSPYQSEQFKYQERQREQERNDFYYRQNQNQQPERRRSNSYGAIAYSVDTGDIGYSEQFASRAQAEQRARRECGKSDCEIAAWFYNSCGALAADDDRTWGGAQGSNEQRARQSAIARCAKEGGKNCQVIATRCSW
jgi:uncharacterized protein DUF4189